MSALLPTRHWNLTNPGMHPMSVMQLSYLASGDTVAVDPSVTAVAAVHLEGGTAPTLSLATPGSGVALVTMTSGSVGRILLIGVVKSGFTVGSGNG